MKNSFHDLETFSPVPLKDGTHRYAERAEILLWAYAVEDGPVSVWDVTAGTAPPADLLATLADSDTLVWFHNGDKFDFVVIDKVMPDLGKLIDIERRRDTMVQAMCHSLPGGLDKLGEALKLPDEHRKHKRGKELVRLFCIPPAKNVKRDRATRETHPEQWAEFISYAGGDIEAMRAAKARMPMWNYQGRELELWQLDQRINSRGLPIDLNLARAAIRAADRAKERLAAQTLDLTDGAVQATTQRDALLKHLLAEYGVSLPDMQSSTLERRIDDPALPWAVKELLKNRLQASSTSVAKYGTLIRATSSDGRMRGTAQFCGAGRTGRWAHRLFQPGNLPSRGLLPQDQIDMGVEAMLANCEHLIFEDVMHLCVSAVRSSIAATPGHKLVCADLANIEGRDQAWLAGEHWKLSAFREFDAGTGPDLYKWAYSKAFNVPIDQVDKIMRQIGKVMELAFGYGGGVGAWVTFALAYDIDLEELAERIFDTLPADLRAEAEDFLAWTTKQKRGTFGLSDRAFIMCDTLKRGWRRGHAAISSTWPELENTVRQAIASPGVTLPCGRLKVRRDGAWLRIVLPSGRALCYPSPQIDEGNSITYMGVNQYSRKWERLKTYGGKLFENVCQATARDVMAWNMPTIEAAGYQIVTTVHDEVVTEAPDSPEFNGEHLASLLCATPPWAEGMPLAAEGFECKRYCK